MPTCPRCGATLKDEYGMNQCPSCGAFSFVDLDGHATAANADAIPETNPETMPVVPMEGMPEDEPLPVEPAPIEPPLESLSGEPVTNPSGEFRSFDAFDPLPDMSSPSFPDPAAEPVLGPADDPLSLHDFANSEVSSAKDGPLHFRVLISGIDTKEIRQSIREVIEDSRFAWDSNEIFAKISKGNLTIDGLSPVKASILITRIKSLPVSIRWEQYAITQGPPI